VLRKKRRDWRREPQNAYSVGGIPNGEPLVECSLWFLKVYLLVNVCVDGVG